MKAKTLVLLCLALLLLLGVGLPAGCGGGAKVPSAEGEAKLTAALSAPMESLMAVDANLWSLAKNAQ